MDRFDRFDTEAQFHGWARPVPLRAALGMYLILCVSVLLFRVVAYWVADAAWIMAGQIALEAGVVGLMPLLYARGVPGMTQSLRFCPIRWKTAILTVLSALTGVLFSVYLLALWTVVLEAIGLTRQPSAYIPENMAMSLVVTAILPGVCEEIFFRGMMLRAWERYGTRRAIVATGVLFAVMHANLSGLPTQLLLGCVLGYIVIASGSVWTGVLYHVLHNAATVVLSNVLPSGSSPGMRVYDAIGGSAGLGVAFCVMVMIGMVYAGLLMCLASDMRRTRRMTRSADARDARLDFPSFIYLVAAIVTVGCLYIWNILYIAGVL